MYPKPYSIYLTGTTGVKVLGLEEQLEMSLP